MELQTIKVHHPDNPDDWMLINRSDYDPKVHRRYSKKRGTISQPMANPEISIDELRSQRTEELQQLWNESNYRAIKPIAEELGIEKPADGWDAAIPSIVDAELPLSD